MHFTLYIFSDFKIFRFSTKAALKWFRDQHDRFFLDIEREGGNKKKKWNKKSLFSAYVYISMVTFSEIWRGRVKYKKNAKKKLSKIKHFIFNIYVSAWSFFLKYGVGGWNIKKTQIKKNQPNKTTLFSIYMYQHGRFFWYMARAGEI